MNETLIEKKELSISITPEKQYPPHVIAVRKEVAKWPDWKVKACGIDAYGNYDPTKTKEAWGL